MAESLLLTLNAGSSSIKVALFDADGSANGGALPAARWSGAWVTS